MAVPKLTLPEIRRRFLQVLSQTGRDGLACQAVGIDEATLYRHVKRDAEFAAARVRAREEFHHHDDPEIVMRCRAALILHLQPHEEEWTAIESETLPDGRVVERRSVKRVKRPPSEWAVRMVIPMLAGRAIGTDLTRLEISGPDGGPVKHAYESEIDREIDQLLAAMAAREEGASAGSPAPADGAQPLDPAHTDT